jgi:MFS family permease
MGRVGPKTWVSIFPHPLTFAWTLLTYAAVRQVGRETLTAFPIRRNTALLAGAMAVNSATLQLVAAVSALTFVLVTGVSGLLGLGPALFLCSSALTAFPAGRLMDRVGRVPVMAGGFAVGSAGAALTALGAWTGSTWVVIPGFVLIGAAGATGQLARAAAGDMYPAARRARGIAYVMFGAVFGAILGPAVFSPIFKGRDLHAAALAMPWLAGAAMMLVALAIVVNVRPDPMRIAEALEGRRPQADGEPARRAAPLGEVLRRPGVVPSMLASVVSVAVMVAMMNLTGYVVVGHRHHAQHLVFPIIGAHVLGMYLLMPAVGWIVDRIGRTQALAGGLALIAVSTAGLMWFEAVAPTAALLFGLGLGWNVSFVAATTTLADLAAPHERGKLLGFNDLVAGFTGAAFVLLGGYVLDDFGVNALAVGASLVALAPIVFILGAGRGRATELGAKG